MEFFCLSCILLRGTINTNNGYYSNELNMI